MKNNRSFRLGRRIIGLALAVCFAFGGAVTAWADAVSTYTVSVSNGQLSILKGGYVTNTFRTNSNNATVATGTDGNLMVCFYDANNKYVGVTLGSQQIVNFYGSIGTLTLDSSLDRPVVIGNTATVTKLEVDAPVKVSIWGKVNSGSVDASATLVAAKGSTVSDVYFNNSGARFYANEGSVVDGTTTRSSEDSTYGSGSSWSSDSSSSSGSSTSSSNSRVELKSSTIYAIYGDTLGDLWDDLDASVQAYNRGGRRLYGTVEWEDRDSTKVKETRRYRFCFTPDDSSYGEATGTVRIVVDDDDDYKEEIYLEDEDLEPIVTSSDNRRLSTYLERLNNRLKFYDEDGKRVYGEAKWTNPGKKVTETDTFKYIFTPYRSKYRSYKGDFQIIVED